MGRAEFGFQHSNVPAFTLALDRVEQFICFVNSARRRMRIVYSDF